MCRGKSKLKTCLKHKGATSEDYKTMSLLKNLNKIVSIFPNLRDIFNIKASGCYVSCYEYSNCTSFKIFNCLFTIHLFTIAMNALAINFFQSQIRCDVVGTVKLKYTIKIKCLTPPRTNRHPPDQAPPLFHAPPLNKLRWQTDTNCDEPNIEQF